MVCSLLSVLERKINLGLKGGIDSLLLLTLLLRLSKIWREEGWVFAISFLILCKLANITNKGFSLYLKLPRVLDTWL
jgi:hypothetical protein